MWGFKKKMVRKADLIPALMKFSESNIEDKLETNNYPTNYVIPIVWILEGEEQGTHGM